MTQKVYYFNMLRVALRLAGVSVRENESAIYMKISLLWLFIMCTYPFLALYDVFTQDFEVVADLLKYEITVLVGVLKIIFLHRKRIDVGKLFEKLEAEPFLANMDRGGDKEKQLIKTCVLITTVQTTLYWGVTAFIWSLDVLYTVMKRIKNNDYRNWGFPFGSFTLFDATRSPNYEISLFYQSICCGWIAALFTIVDLTMAAVLVHLCFQLKILQHYFKCMVNNDRERMLKEQHDNGITAIANEVGEPNYVQLRQSEWKYLNKSLKQAVKHHLAIISIATEMNESFGTLLLMIFFGTLCILSFMVYKVSLISLNDSHLVGSVGELVIITLQVVLVCFWGEELVFESEQVGRAAFHSDFVGTDLRFQKGLMLIIRRSQTPLKLTAGKFIDIGLGALTRIVRSTYSAFMVLRKRNART